MLPSLPCPLCTAAPSAGQGRSREVGKLCLAAGEVHVPGFIPGLLPESHEPRDRRECSRRTSGASAAAVHATSAASRVQTNSASSKASASSMRLSTFAAASKVRFTPTHVGTTLFSPTGAAVANGSPPRTWGQRRGRSVLVAPTTGSPPRTWGQLAGCAEVAAEGAVHPHACGDNSETTQDRSILQHPVHPHPPGDVLQRPFPFWAGGGNGSSGPAPRSPAKRGRVPRADARRTPAHPGPSTVASPSRP